MKRRKLISGLGTLSATGAIAIGTGAFTSASANRTVSVRAVGDANAFLAMRPSPGANGAYASLEDGQLEINLDGTADEAAGQGVNDDAVTKFRDVFRIHNQGTQPVFVFIDDSSDLVTFKAGKADGRGGAGSDRIKDRPISLLTPNETVDIETSENALRVPVGDGIRVHLFIDTTGDSTPNSILEEITIHAESTPPSNSPFG